MLRLKIRVSVVRFRPWPPSFSKVHSGRMVYGLFRRHGLHLLRGEGIGCGFDAHFIPIEEA